MNKIKIVFFTVSLSLILGGCAAQVVKKTTTTPSYSVTKITEESLAQKVFAPCPAGVLPAEGQPGCPETRELKGFKPSTTVQIDNPEFQSVEETETSSACGWDGPCPYLIIGGGLAVGTAVALCLAGVVPACVAAAAGVGL